MAETEGRGIAEAMRFKFVEPEILVAYLARDVWRDFIYMALEPEGQNLNRKFGSHLHYCRKIKL